MKIEELQVGGFGKWRQATFAFKPGLNLIVAPNEAGKSTLLQAMFAALYGMKKDYVTAPRYLDEYGSYYPWDKGSYETTIRYTLGGQAFRLHRHLHKDHEQARLYLEPERSDITFQYKEDRRKEFDFIERHLGLTRTLFTDVTWVKREPMSATEYLVPSLLREEVQDPIIQRILSELEQTRSTIGKKETAESTLLGKANKQLVQASQELERAEQAWQSVKHVSTTVVQWQHDLTRLAHQQEQKQLQIKEVQEAEQELQRLWARTYETKTLEQLFQWEEEAWDEEERNLHLRTREELMRIAEAEQEWRRVAQAERLRGELVAEPGGPLDYSIFTLVGWSQETAAPDVDSTVDTEQLQADYRMGRELLKEIEETKQASFAYLHTVAEKERAYHETEELLTMWREKETALSEAYTAERQQREAIPQITDYDPTLAEKAKRFFIQHATAPSSTAFEQSSSYAVSRTRSRSKRHRSKRKKAVLSSTPMIVAGSFAVIAGIAAVLWYVQGQLLPATVAAILGLLFTAWSGYQYRCLSVSQTGAKGQTTEPSTTEADKQELTPEITAWLQQVSIEKLSQLLDLEKVYQAWQEALRSKEALEAWFEQQPVRMKSELEGLVQERKSEWERLQTERTAHDEKHQAKESQLATLLARWEIEHWDAFATLCEQHLAVIHQSEARKRAQVLEEELAQERLRTRQVSELETLETDKLRLLNEWEADIREILQDRRSQCETYRRQWEQERTGVEKRIQERREQIARAQGEIGQRDEVFYAEAKSAHLDATEQIEQLLLRRDALNLSKDLLQEAQKEWQREVSPDTNTTVSRIMYHITEGRYEDVRLDPAQRFAIRVIEPKYREVVEQEQLSTGTQDQLYFAQRVALLRHLSEERESLPLFLDDHFIHYDEQRLERTLLYLLDMAKVHQIFLFSCQEREREYLAQYMAAQGSEDLHAVHDWR